MEELTEIQEKILFEFIQRFLPQKGNYRKSNGNELEYVFDTLSRVVKRNFGFSISKENVLAQFEKLNYTFYTKNGVWDINKKEFKPTSLVLPNNFKGSTCYKEMNAMYIYIDIFPKDVRNLMLTTVKLGDKTSISKVIIQRNLRLEIEKLKVKHQCNITS